jgi:hypothetical protein
MLTDASHHFPLYFLAYYTTLNQLPCLLAPLLSIADCMNTEYESDSSTFIGTFLRAKSGMPAGTFV